MDTPIYTPPAAPIQAHPNRRRLFIIIGIAVVLVLIFGSLFLWKAGKFDGGLVPHDERLTISVDSLPLAPAQVLNLKDGTVSPLQVEGVGTAVLIDTASSEAYDYFLIADADLSKVNLYRQDREHPETGVDQVTESDTIKFDLSVDPATETAAYVSVAEDGTSSVMVIGPATAGEEKDLGTGRHPVLLPGAFFVLVERNSELLSIRVETEEEHTLLSVALNSPVAVDTKGMKVAIIEPTKNIIQEYSVAGMTSASYLGNDIPVNGTVRELAYIGKQLLRLTADGDTVAVTGGNTVVVLPATLLPSIVGNFKLATYHD